MEDPSCFIIRPTQLHQYIIIIGPYYTFKLDKASVPVFFLWGGGVSYAVLCLFLLSTFFFFFFFICFLCSLQISHQLTASICSSTLSNLQVNTCEGLCVWQKLFGGGLLGQQGNLVDSWNGCPCNPTWEEAVQTISCFPRDPPLSGSSQLNSLNCRFIAVFLPQPLYAPPCKQAGTAASVK